VEKVTFINEEKTPPDIKLDSEDTPLPESSETDDYMFGEDSAKQEQTIQDVSPEENNAFAHSLEANTIEETIHDSEAIIESTLGLDEKDGPKIPEDHVPPLFDSPDEEDGLVLKPAPLESEVEKLNEDLFEKPPEGEDVKITNLEDTRKPIQELETPDENILPPAFESEHSDDNVFQIKPKRDQKDLEKEIIPLIERIEQESKSSSENDEEENDDTTELPVEETLSDSATYNKTLQDPENIKLEETDFTFIDEELLKQSSIQMKQEQSENVEFEKTSQPLPGIKQEPEKVVVPILSSKQDKIVLISMDDDCKDEIMDILTNDNFKSINISATDGLKIELGKIHFESFSKFKLVAASVEKNLNSFFRSVKQSTAGNIFVFDCSRPETWEYTSYLIHSIWFKFRIPYVVAVMNFKEQISITMEVIQYKLDLKENITLVAWDEDDKAIPEKLLQAVIFSTRPESPDAITAPEASPIQ